MMRVGDFQKPFFKRLEHATLTEIRLNSRLTHLSPVFFGATAGGDLKSLSICFACLR